MTSITPVGETVKQNRRELGNNLQDSCLDHGLHAQTATVVLWELIQRGCISLESSDVESLVQAMQNPRSPAMTVQIYEQLAMLNTGFDQVRRSLAALARYREFDRPTLVQFSERAEEARAATNSYLASVIEAAETAEAGRRFGKRRAREEAEEGTEIG
jgi:hypothetical protein